MKYKVRKLCSTLFIALIVVLLSVSCRNRNTVQSEQNSTVAEKKDSGFLFDGNSLNGWEITNFGPQGPVSVSGDKIVLGMGDGCTGITWLGHFPDENYRVSLDAMRVAGNDFFCGLTFPVGKEPCTLIVGGWAGTTVGLSCIDGKDASENSTSIKMKFDKNRWYHISLTVTGKQITAEIDSIKVVDFVREGHKFSVRPEVRLSEPFGIASWNTTAAIKNIKLDRIKSMPD